MDAYKAKWILTASEGDYKPVYENYALIVDDGKITDIIPQDDVYDEIYETVEDFGNSIITPGFINLDANLHYKSPTGCKNFFTKIKQFFAMLGTPINNYAMKLADIEAEKLSLNSQQKLESFKENLKNELCSGTTCLVQTVKADKTGKIFFEVLNKIPIKTFLSLEIWADSPLKSNRAFRKIKKAYNLFKKEKTDSTYFCLNPKSIWQVHKKLWRFLGKFSKRNNLLMFCELLESQEELNFLNGEFSYLEYYNKFLGNKKIPYESGKSVVEYLNDLKVLKDNLIIANGNFLNSKELEVLAENGVNMVFSPTINRKVFNKCLSNETILRNFSKKFAIMTRETSNSVLEELLSLKLSIPFEEQIKYITLYPAKMLKTENITGSLDYNKHADFNVFKLEKKQKLITDLQYIKKPYAIYILCRLVVKDGEISV